MNAIAFARPSKAHLRPSLLDPNLKGDPWMSCCATPGLLVLDLCNYPIAIQPGTRLEQAAFNSLIFQLRQKAN